MLYRALLLALFMMAVSTSALSVCEAGEDVLLGEFVKVDEMKMDGAPVYSQVSEGEDAVYSFFRNKGFWYLGNLEPWPPETYYRCVDPDGCSMGEEFPPITSDAVGWTASKMFGSEPVPKIVEGACENDEL